MAIIPYFMVHYFTTWKQKSFISNFYWKIEKRINVPRQQQRSIAMRLFLRLLTHKNFLKRKIFPPFYAREYNGDHFGQFSILCAQVIWCSQRRVFEHSTQAFFSIFSIISQTLQQKPPSQLVSIYVYQFSQSYYHTVQLCKRNIRLLHENTNFSKSPAMPD